MINQFGSFYFDPKDIVAIDTNPELVAEKYYYHIYLRNVVAPIILKGEAAMDAMTAFWTQKGR